MQIPHSPNPYLPVYSAAGVKLEAGPEGVLLASGTTYYVGIGGEEAPLQSVHIQGVTAALILTSVEVEDSNNPDATIVSSTAGEWIKENPSTAYVAYVGTGWLATLAVVSAAGTGAGGAMIHLGNTGAKRTRLRVVVGGTGGYAKFMGHGKA